MSEDEGPDSDSSGSDVRKSVTRIRSRRRKEARICYSSRTTTVSLQDPMPEYVDPELVKLIAQNAPFELDVFVRSLGQKSGSRRRAEKNKGMRDGGAVGDGERGPSLPVEMLLSSVRERNDHLSARNKPGRDVRHSCPERMWSDYGEKDEDFINRTKAVKRKRPKGLDGFRRPRTDDRPFPVAASLRKSVDKGRNELRGSGPGNPVASGVSSDEGSSDFLGEEEGLSRVKADPSDVSLAAAPYSVADHCDVLNAKPWRHGMRKGTRSAAKAEWTSHHSTCCKRKAEVADSRKTSEVRKYMETNMSERRKEQQQLKAEADAALVARKEQQRRLDLHRQATFQSQVSGGKSREHVPRPAWVSEYSNLCEPPRPWSSSSGELNAYLPPPMTPPKLEVVPLDLYATQLQYAGHPSTPRMDGIQLHNAQPREKRRSKKVKGCSREVQRQLKYRKSHIMNELPHIDVELNKAANSSVKREAKWKAKTKSRGRKLFSEEFFELQLLANDEVNLPQRSGDLDVYKRSLQRQSHSNGRTLCKGSRTQNSTSRASPKTRTKSVRPPDSCVVSAIRDHGRPFSKVKRLKPSEGFIPCKKKDLTGEELAILLNANRVPSDCESETNAEVNAQVVAEKMIIVRSSPPSPAASNHEVITDLRKCVGHSLGSPLTKYTTDEEDVICKWFGPSVECSENHLIDEDVQQQGNRGQMLDNSLKPTKSKEVQLQQVLDFQKEKVRDSEVLRATTKKQTTLGVRWQRMQLLKNLADQLVKRVNAACAKKRQIECSAVEQINSPRTDIDTSHSEVLAPAETGHATDSVEPKPKMDIQPKLSDDLSSTRLEGSIFDDKKSGESENKFFHHHQPKQNNVLHGTGLTEQEQAGCGTPLHLFGMEQTQIQSSSTFNTRRASMSEANDHNKPAFCRDSNEGCTIMDWTSSDKGTDITSVNPLACSSYGPSSLSTVSSSPVILPTSSKYHLGRFKHGKKVSTEEKTRCRPKALDWIIPVENDTHSIFNVYTQHLKNREKLATGTFPDVVQNDLEKMEIDAGIAEPEAHVDMPTFGLIPLSRKVTMSDLPVKPVEPMSLPIVQSTEGRHESTVSLENVVGTGLNPHRKQHLSSSNFESLQNMVAEADKHAFTPSAELNSLKTDAMAGNSEVTILEIGDLKLCQSSTSFHLRLDRCKGNRDDTKPKEQPLVNISRMPNVKNYSESSPATCVDNSIPPMKVTYARRVHSRAMPDGGCTDERVVVELHQRRPDVSAVQVQGDTILESPKLDASEDTPQGLTSSPLNKGIGNAQSKIQEGPVKLSAVNEHSKKKGHMSSKIKGNMALQPTIDHVLDHNKLVARAGETGSPCTSMNGQKEEVATQLNYSSNPDPRIDLRDSQELELKHRRNQLEAELQKLDAEIMKTRARLHQRHYVIDSQAQTVSIGPEQPVEGSPILDKSSNIPANDLAIRERHNVVFEASPDVLIQKTAATAHSSPKARKDEEKNATSSISYSDSFVSDNTGMGQQTLPGTGTCDSFADDPLTGKARHPCGQSFREPIVVNKQFELALARCRGSQSHVVKKQVEAQSYCETPSTQGDFASEGSEMSTGRGPGRRLDMPPPRVDSAAAWRRILSKVRATIRPVIPDQMVEINVGEDQVCDKDEGNKLKRGTAATGDDELLGAVQYSVNTTTDDISRKGPRTSSDSIPQVFEGIVTEDKRQTSFQQNARVPADSRNSRELPECGAKESHSSVARHGSRNTETNNNPMLWGTRNGRLVGITGVDISDGNGVPSASTQQNGRPMRGKQRGDVPTCDDVEAVLSCPIESEQKEGRPSYTVVPGALLLSSGWTTSEKGSGGVPRSELGQGSQMKGEEVMETKKTELSGSCQNSKTLVAAEVSCTIVAAAEDLHCALQQISPSLMENPGETFSECNIGPSNNVKGQMKSTLHIGKLSSCSHAEGQISDEAAATILPQFGHAASLTPVRSIPCNSTANEKADWKCLSLPSHMDFSTIKKKLRNNKLAVDGLRPFSNGWSSYQNETCKSPSISEEVGGYSSGVQTVGSEGIIPNDVSHSSQNFLDENLSSVEIQQAVKSTCPSEMEDYKESGLRRLSNLSENTLISKADPSFKYSDAQELMMPRVSSAGEVPNFFQSLYFRQDMIKSSEPSAEMESTISEDLENYESDIVELQDDAVSSGCKVETTSSWKASSPISSNNVFGSSKPDPACSVGIGSPDTKIFNSDSGFLSVNGLSSGISEVCKSSSIHNITNQDLTVLGVPKPCGTGRPPTELLSRQPENRRSLLQAEYQCRSQPSASFASPGDADWAVSGSIRAAVNEDDSNLPKIARVSDNYYCGSDVSHLPSESISEEVRSVDSETSSYRTGPLRENHIHRVDLVGLKTRKESNEDDDGMQKNCVDNAGKPHACNSVISSSTRHEPPDFNENADRRRYSIGTSGLTTTAGTAGKDNPDINFSSTDCVATASLLQETARNRDDSHDHAVLPIGDAVKFESSKSIALPISCKIPQLRTQEDFIHGNVPHFFTASNFGKLSCAQEVRETLRPVEKDLLENVSGMKIESAYNRLLVSEIPSNASPGGSTTGPGEVVKIANSSIYGELSDPGIVCNLDVAIGEGSPILGMQNTVDHLVSGPSSHQMGPIQGYDEKQLAVDVVFGERDSSCKNALAEEMGETEQLSDEIHELSYSFTAADSSSDNENASNNIVSEEDNESAAAVCSHIIHGYPQLGLRTSSHQEKKGIVVSKPVDSGGSRSDPPTFAAKDTLASSCRDLLIGTREQLPKYRIVNVEPKPLSFDFVSDDNRGSATSPHQMVPADRDFQETKTSDRSQNICLGPDRINEVEAYNTNKLSRTSVLLGNQQLDVDFDNYAEENQAHDTIHNRQVNLGIDYIDTNSEFEGQSNNQMDYLVGSLQSLQTHLPLSQYSSITSESSTSCCRRSSSKQGFLSQTLDNIVPRDSSVKQVHDLPRAEDREECCSDIIPSNVLTLRSAEENTDMEKNEVLSRCETQEDYVGCLGSQPIGSDDAPDVEQTISTTSAGGGPTALHEASCCLSTGCDAPTNMLGGIMEEKKIQADAIRAEKHNIMTDLLTSMIYDDLLCVELSGFHHEDETTSLETPEQINQTANLTKVYSKVKSRSRKVSEFCQVLKSFLPIGWRAASIRHKTGLFLHVEGLRPHPLNPATRAMPVTLKGCVQYPVYGQSEHYSKIATPKLLFLGLTDLHSYVQRSIEVSSLLLDPRRPQKWYDPKKLVVEHASSPSHLFEHSPRQIHEKLISDLVNEILLKQFATKLLVPSVGMPSLPLPAGGEDLVQFVTNGILKHESYASTHGFDIEKVIAKAFEDEHWEKCSEEATKVIGDLAQDILGDLIERFVYEMIRGLCYYINHCHVLAT